MLVQFLCALVDPDVVSGGKMVQHPVELFGFGLAYRRVLVCPMDNIGISGADDALGPDDVRDIVDHAGLVDPFWYFYLRGQVAA